MNINVYRIRRPLAIIGLDKLIVGKSGTFVINPAYHIHTDFDRFEENCRKLERTSDPDIRCALYHKAVELYKGHLLPRIEHEIWHMQLDMYYQTLYLTITKGYARYKLERKNYTDALHEIKNASLGYRARTGKMWHHATVRGILCNLTYTGVLRSGESRSEILPHLQIIEPELFDAAQRIRTARANAIEQENHVPLNTRGQYLLAGNVFCGHCGSRLSLTTNGKAYPCKALLRSVKTDYTKAAAELDALKSEVVKAIKGASSFSKELLASLILDAERKCQELQAALEQAQADYDAGEATLQSLNSQYDDMISWAEMYDSASVESKKMIVSCLIRRVDVYRGYRVHIDFNIDFKQFSLGLDIAEIAA